MDCSKTNYPSIIIIKISVYINMNNMGDPTSEHNQWCLEKYYKFMYAYVICKYLPLVTCSYYSLFAQITTHAAIIPFRLQADHFFLFPYQHQRVVSLFNEP